ncbi:isopentenyl-diphosphate Delta-isomerase [Salinactinospora qingdaonensis]|uniref:Isopentenyl-diphosphate Delta-isomerase n=1 Tax=Salinactinospora qingdaonensis TaxID=702744 RepID=A0ABP7GB80_9ACTN
MTSMTPPSGGSHRAATAETEEIVLLGTDGEAIGTAPKRASHHGETPLHLAFSCYLADASGRVLMTRRADHKPTWPSVWTNSCCGHPAPGEGLRAAVTRRVGQELGADITDLTLILPGFGYRAVMDDGTVEYELCPVVRATVSGRIDPDPAEVAETGWIDWSECVALAGRAGVSPWFTEQIAELAPLGTPHQWPEGDPAQLPPAVDW